MFDTKVPTTSGVIYYCSDCGDPIFGSATFISDGDGAVLCNRCALKRRESDKVDQIIYLLEQVKEELQIIRMKRRW